MEGAPFTEVPISCHLLGSPGSLARVATSKSGGPLSEPALYAKGLQWISCSRTLSISRENMEELEDRQEIFKGKLTLMCFDIRADALGN